jgi:hypothetical protein
VESGHSGLLYIPQRFRHYLPNLSIRKQTGVSEIPTHHKNAIALAEHTSDRDAV